MARFYFRKMIYDNVEVVAMFEHGEIQRPLAILFPDDVKELNELTKEKVCKCGHKQWEDYKCSFEPMVAQECSVKGCKCKKFVSERNGVQDGK